MTTVTTKVVRWTDPDTGIVYRHQGRTKGDSWQVGHCLGGDFTPYVLITEIERPCTAVHEGGRSCQALTWRRFASGTVEHYHDNYGGSDNWWIPDFPTIHEDPEL